MNAAAPALAGTIVVTRFDCPSRWTLLVVFVMHKRMKRHVRRHTSGFLGVRTVVNWRDRSLLNISLWSDSDSVYSMGNVPHHIAVAHLTPKMGVRTSGALYPSAGDWRQVLFAVGRPARPTRTSH